jgi:hypothetical protein
MLCGSRYNKTQLNESKLKFTLHHLTAPRIQRHVHLDFYRLQKRDIFIVTAVRTLNPTPGLFNVSGSAGRIETFNETRGPLGYNAVFRIVRCFPLSQETLRV